MKRTIITLGLVGLMSSCGIQFGDYERWKDMHGEHNCQVDEREYEFTSAYGDCENCDEVD